MCPNSIIARLIHFDLPAVVSTNPFEQATFAVQLSKILQYPRLDARSADFQSRVADLDAEHRKAWSPVHCHEFGSSLL